MIDVIVNILMWVALGVCAAKWAVLSSKARMLRSALEDTQEDNDYLRRDLERSLDDYSKLELGRDEMETGYQQEILSLDEEILSLKEEIKWMESIQKSQSFELFELNGSSSGDGSLGSINEDLQPYLYGRMLEGE